MGIVYEAEQESLGRHVALKVLPSSAPVNSTFLERFRREAKAVARLHHTNIVPVFGVGECDGVPYYAMQFIRGQGLDRVLSDIRRLRRSGTSTIAEAKSSDQSVALSLITGQFAHGTVSGPDAQLESPASSPSTTGLSGGSPEGEYHRSPQSACRSPRGWLMLTARASCTATSSRRTCFSINKA